MAMQNWRFNVGLNYFLKVKERRGENLFGAAFAKIEIRGAKVFQLAARIFRARPHIRIT